MGASSLFSHLPLPGKSMTTLPPFIYGTAWKGDLTTSLVQQALHSGFTAIDTAGQPKHYREDLVGEGVRRFLSSPNGKLKRSDLYIQTKFTSIHGQDPNKVPYNPKSSLTEQVQQSIETSLRNFTISSSNEEPYLDSLVLHSPMPDMRDTQTVWTALEAYVPTKIRHLGISNTSLDTLTQLYQWAKIKPAVVQNRFYASTEHDVAVRKFCVEKGMVYQSFWTLTGNPQLMKCGAVLALAEVLELDIAQALYALVLGLGNMVILNGTKNKEHMLADWAMVERVRMFIEEDRDQWESIMTEFRKHIGEVVD